MPSATKKTCCATQGRRLCVAAGATAVCWFLLPVIAGGLARAADPPPLSASLEQQLLQETPAALAQAARQRGDVNRGAILFYQPYLTCTKCHSLDQQTTPLGPDLTQPGPEVNDVYLVEAVLQPSKAIKKGFEPIVVITDDGKSITGLLAEDRPEALVLRDPAQDGKTITIPKDRIEEQAPGPLSVMPAGLVIGLADRQQFLDLIRYLIEITEKGLTRARQLEPPPHLYALPPIPEYEKDIDHAGLLAELNAGLLQTRRGHLQLPVRQLPRDQGPARLAAHVAAVRRRDVQERVRTLSDVPNADEGFRHDDAADLDGAAAEVRRHPLHPRGVPEAVQPDPVCGDRCGVCGLVAQRAGRGPQPETIEPWITMDYGPHLTATYEVGSDQTNFAYKGIAVRLDPGPGGVSRGSHWMLYDHDTLRVAAAWSGQGFIDWDAILFNGRHQVHPRPVGQIHLANPTGPGWADPDSGGFEDPRIRGRDNRPYGPLPRTWAHYRGLYDFGNQAIVAYTVGDTELLETPGIETSQAVPVYTRTFQVGPRSKDLVLQVAQHPGAVGLPAGEQRAEWVAFGRAAERPDAGADARTARWPLTAQRTFKRPSRRTSIWRATITPSRRGSIREPAAASCAKRQRRIVGCRTASRCSCVAAGWCSTSAGSAP